MKSDEEYVARAVFSRVFENEPSNNKLRRRLLSQTFARGLPEPNEIGQPYDATRFSSILRSASTAGFVFHESGNKELEYCYKSGFLHKTILDGKEAYRLPSPVHTWYILTCHLSGCVLNLF
jgi:hypothetical protein